jgi:3-oxoacyl-[acyl-carrier protein] reductase
MSEVPTYPDLAGRVAFVTGGSKGIGAGCCRAFAANGVKVAVNARSQPGIDALVEELRAGGAEAMGVAGDCTSAADLARAREEVERELGPVDIVLSFAGGFEAFTPISEITDEEWHAVIDWNLTSTFLTVREFVPGMIERRRGSIVTMSSNGGRYLDKLLTASYAAAKAGIVQFTRHVAMELGEHGIRANVIAPGTVTTERVERIMDDEAMRKVAAMSPLGRMGTVDDCAFAVLYLVSDSASWMTGVTLDVAGGRIMM